MSLEAEVVFERDEAFTMGSGSYGYERVGVKYRLADGTNRVFWIGTYYWPQNDSSGQAAETWKADQRFANALVAAAKGGTT